MAKILHEFSKDLRTIFDLIYLAIKYIQKAGYWNERRKQK